MTRSTRPASLSLYPFASFLSVLALLFSSPPARAQSAIANVLQVGTYKGKPGAFTKLQDAVDAAQPGDWILIAPAPIMRKVPPMPASSSPLRTSTFVAWTAT